MKIAIITKRFHTNLYYRAKALKDAGHEIFLLVWGKGQSEYYDSLDPFVIGYSKFFTRFNRLIEKIPNKKIVEFIKFRLPFLNLEEMIDYKQLKKRLKEIKPDVSLVRGYPGFSFLQMIICAKRYSRKVFLLSQLNKHYGETLRKRSYLLLMKKILKLQGIITPLKNILDKKDPFFIYIPFVIEAPDFCKEYFKDSRINIISVGKFMERKEHLLLLGAVNELKNKYNLSLTLVGERRNSALLEKIKEYIEVNELENIVSIKTDLSYNEALAEYRGADLFVLPSHSEPAAYSPLEAMAAKLPVIVSDTCGTRCYIEEGENGYVFKSRDMKDLKDKMEAIIKDRENLIRMGEKSFAYVQGFHFPKVFAQNFLKIIK